MWALLRFLWWCPLSYGFKGILVMLLVKLFTLYHVFH